MRGLSLKQIFWGLLALLIPCAFVMLQIDYGLRNATTPNGIVSFELCAYTSSCNAALATWGASGQILAMLSLGFDYIFMVLYPSFICVGLLLSAQHLSATSKKATIFAAWFSLVAGLADAVETYALIQIVLNQSGSFYGELAAVFATIKFTILGVTVVWLVATTILYLFNRRKVA